MKAFYPPLAILTLLLSHASLHGYEVSEVKDGGTVQGNVRFEGSPPKPRKIKILKDEEICGKGERLINEVALSKEGGLANAVVFLEGIAKGKGWQEAPEGYLLDQKGCRFLPEVSIIPRGKEAMIQNSDATAHNIHTYEMMGRSRSTLFNIAQPFPGKIKKALNTRRGGQVVKVECDIHNFMHGWVFLADTPYYTISDAEGKFSLTDVPPGKYKVILWHPVLGEMAREATVQPNKTAAISIEWKGEENKK